MIGWTLVSFTNQLANHGNYLQDSEGCKKLNFFKRIVLTQKIYDTGSATFINIPVVRERVHIMYSIVALFCPPLYVIVSDILMAQTTRPPNMIT